MAAWFCYLAELSGSAGGVSGSSRSGRETRGEGQELEAGEEVARLAVELFLHLRVHLLAWSM